MSGYYPPGVTDNDPHFDGGECEHTEVSGGYCDDCGELVDEATAAEAAYERSLERYYGSDTPVTMDEQHRAAWEEKQNLRR